MSEAQVNDVDQFIAGYKTCDGFMPEWVRSNGRGRDWQSRWPIIEAMGIKCGMLCFECDATLTKLSISVIYNQKPIYRLDMVPQDERKENHFAARIYAPQLPRIVEGSHTHTWEDHRGWVREQGLGELPFRRPLDGPVASLEHAVEIVANGVNLTLTPAQRSVALPAQAGLFSRNGGGSR